MSHTRKKANRQGGFTLLELVIAMTVLAVGMLGVAAMLCNLDSNTGRSRYMSVAALLASEKLEQLSGFPASDPNIEVSSGTTAGGLTANTSSGTIDYYDQVSISAASGTIAETTISTDGSGNTVYSTITQSPNGEVVSSSNLPTAPSSLNFQRRWLIEKDVPVAGVCRITVLATLLNSPTQGAVNSQMSMVRQYN